MWEWGKRDEFQTMIAKPFRCEPSGKEHVHGVLFHDNGEIVTYGERNCKIWRHNGQKVRHLWITVAHLLLTVPS